MRKTFILFAAGLLMVIRVASAQKTTAQDGPWDLPATWTDNIVPSITDIIQIDHTVSLNGNMQCQSLIIGSAGKLTISENMFTVGEVQWVGNEYIPCGQYYLRIDGILEITGGQLYVGGLMFKNASGTFKMSDGLVRVKRGGCGGNFEMGNLVQLTVDEGDVTGGTFEVYGNTGSARSVVFSNFGPNSLIRIGSAVGASAFTGQNISPSFYYYFSMIFNKVGNVEINNIVSASPGPIRPMILSGGSLDLARINGNFTLTSNNTILVGEETFSPTPSTMGLVVGGNFINSSTLQMASGRVFFLGGEGAYSVANQRPYCSSFTNTSQLLSGSGTVAGSTCNCNQGTISLGSAMTLSDLTLGAGKIALGNYDLSLQNLRNETPQSGYFITNGTGKLKLKYGYISGSNVVYRNFPVGSAERYNPVGILYPPNMGAAVEAEVSVGVKHVFSHTPSTTKNVVVEWDITSTSNAPANVTFTWDEADEAGGFDRSSLAISRYNGTSWEVQASGLSASGEGPFSAAISGVTQFSPWAIFDSQGALPVTLSAFDVRKENQTARLTWTTTTESNASHFEVERSADAGKWWKVGEVQAEGESNTLRHYSFADSKLSNLVYYRLRMVDYDGTYTYSDIKSLKFGSGLNTIKPYPNPVSERLILHLPDWKDVTTLRMISIAGRPWELTSEVRHENPSLDVTHLPAGIYQLQISYKNSPPEMHRVVISR